MKSEENLWICINQLVKDKASAKIVDQLVRDFSNLEQRCTMLESTTKNIVHLLAAHNSLDEAHP